MSKTLHIMLDAAGTDAATIVPTTTVKAPAIVVCTGDTVIGPKPDLSKGLCNRAYIGNLRSEISPNMHAPDEEPDTRAYDTIVRSIYPKFFQDGGEIAGIRQAIQSGSTMLLLFLLLEREPSLDALTVPECDRALWLLQVARHDPLLSRCFTDSSYLAMCLLYVIVRRQDRALWLAVAGRVT